MEKRIISIAELKLIEQKPVVVANHQSVIIFVNNKFERVFGWNNNEIISKPISTIIPKNFHDAHHLGFSRFQSTGKSTILNHPLQLTAVKKNGEIFPAEHIIYAENINGDWIFAATIESKEK